MAARPSSCPTCGLALPEGAQDCPQCSAQTVDLRTPFPPISGYTMIHALGEGGMGAVYLASDETLGRRVAVKVISRRYASDAESSARFLREARSMATVEHPHIVRVYAFGESEGQAYLVMEYVEGEDLAQSVKRRGPHSAGEALRIVRQVVDALEAAWEHNIVHRDIKPSNILLDKRGRVRVADFGLAKPMRMEGDATLSANTYVLGTPHYAAPEQIRGREVDFRSDIYSLGIVLYEMLAGERPFEGATPFDVIDKQVREPLPALKKKRPETPEGVVQLLDWMTQKDPAQRPASYTALLERIDAMLSGLPVTPAPSGVSTPAPQERPRLYPVFVALAVLAVAAAGWFAWTQINVPITSPPVSNVKQFVVAVTPFYGPDEDSAKEGKVMAALVEKAIAQKLGKENAKILGVEETKQPVRDHDAARALGERMGANVVVWGEAFTLRGETELQPYFTIIPPKQETTAKGANAAQRTLLGKDPLAALQEQSAQATVVQATAPNQIQLRKTTAEGMGEMSMFLAGLHALYTKGDAALALKFFDSAPRNAVTLQHRAEALSRLSQAGAALKTIRDAVALDPRSAAIQARLGDLELEAEHLREAEIAYRAAAQNGGEYVTKNGIVADGRLYVGEVHKEMNAPWDTRWGTGFLYLLQLDSESGHVRERYLLPGVPETFRPKDGGIEMEYESIGGEKATVRFVQGKLDRPLHHTQNLLNRRRAVTVGTFLLGNFETDANLRKSEHPKRYALKVKAENPNKPSTIGELERAARAAIEKDPTHPGFLYVLGQALWAQDKKDEAEKVWARIFEGGFPAIPYYVYSWMAADLEQLGQRKWADRAFAEALKRRKAMAQPIGVNFLIERLISMPFVAIAAEHSRSGRDLERAYTWLERTREIGGPCLEGEDVVAAAWEKYFRDRNDTQRANHEAAVRRQVLSHPGDFYAAAARTDLSIYAASALMVSFFVLFGLLLARGKERCSLLGAPKDQPSSPALEIRWGIARIGRYVREALLGVSGVTLLGFGLVIIGWGRREAAYVILGLGLLVSGNFVYRWKRGRLMRPLPPFRKWMAATTRAERAVLSTALAAVLVAMGVLTYVVTRLEVTASLPMMMDTLGHAEVIWSLEGRLKGHDTPNRRYVAAVANHYAGNSARAKQLYQSLPQDPRAQKNLAALEQGSLSPPVPLTYEEVRAASLELTWEEWLQRIWRPGQGIFRNFGDATSVTPMLNALIVSSRIVFVLGILLIVVFWRNPARKSDEMALIRGKKSRWLARIGFSLLPGLFDLRRGSVWRGYVVLTFVSLILLVACARAAIPSSFETWVPGIVSALCTSNLPRSFPLPTPPGIADDHALRAYHYWTFFWAYPYAKAFWTIVTLAGLIALELHITRLRAIWRT